MIFISYRRDDESYFVNHLCESMGNAFGKKRVMMDIDSVPLAVDFRKHVSEQIKRARVTLAVVGPRWETALQRSGQQPRILSPRDYVRCELEAAYAAGIPIIPVYVGRDANLDESQLPESLRFFPYLNGVVIERNDAVNATFRRLREHLESMLSSAANEQLAPTTWLSDSRLRNSTFSGIAIEHVPFCWELMADGQDPAGVIRVTSDDVGRVVLLRCVLAEGETTLRQTAAPLSRPVEIRFEVDACCRSGIASMAISSAGTNRVSRILSPGPRGSTTLEAPMSAGDSATVSIACQGVGEVVVYCTRLWVK